MPLLIVSFLRCQKRNFGFWVNIRSDRPSAPKGPKISAQGFNPGLVDLTRCAPKAAPDGDWVGGSCTNSPESRQVWCPFPPSSHIPELRRTGRAHRFLTPNPGSKPWAMTFCPFLLRRPELRRTGRGRTYQPPPSLMKSPILHAFLTTAASISVACSITPASAQDNKPPVPSGNVTVSFWGIATQPWQVMIDDFQKTYPNIKRFSAVLCG